MDLSLSLDAKSVLFHLNYMGYRNVTKDQLKGFMIDLKKLIKYESSPRGSTTEIQIQAGPTPANIQRLFEAHTVTSKQKEKPKEVPRPNRDHQHLKQQNQPQKLHRHQPEQRPEKFQEPQRPPLPSKHRFRTPSFKDITEAVDNEVPKIDKPTRIKSAETARPCRKESLTNDKPKQKIATNPTRKQLQTQTADKENIPTAIPPQPAKSKMWIRPKSGSQVTRKAVKRTDPVSLYQAYQKDWEKFKTNICESSHSDLRWTIREKMMGNN